MLIRRGSSEITVDHPRDHGQVQAEFTQQQDLLQPEQLFPLVVAVPVGRSTPARSRLSRVQIGSCSCGRERADCRRSSVRGPGPNYLWGAGAGKKTEGKAGDMPTDLADRLVRTERQRIQALLNVDQVRFDELHDESYLLCNPTGAVWNKAEYLGRLTSGRLAYRRLDLVTGIDVLTADALAILRYRCVIELRADGTDIPGHECWHVDAYTLGDQGWRCRWSQATGILDTIPQPAG